MWCSLAHHILEHEVIIWDPHTSNDIDQLKRVQRWFLRFAKLLFKIPFEEHHYRISYEYIHLLIECAMRN